MSTTDDECWDPTDPNPPTAEEIVAWMRGRKPEASVTVEYSDGSTAELALPDEAQLEAEWQEARSVLEGLGFFDFDYDAETNP